MKKVLFITLVSTIFMFFSCTDELSISTDVVAMLAKNSTQSIEITASSNWVAKCSNKWVTMSDSTGKGNKSIDLTCKDNYSGAARTAQITIQEGKQTKTVIINQDGGEILLNEHFNDNSLNWIITNDSIKTTIANSYYSIRSDTKYYSNLVGTKSLIPFYAGDYMISTNYKITLGTGAFGLTFGFKDTSNFYRILVFQEGVIIVSQIANRNFLTIYNTVITNYQNENTLSLVKVGNNCTIYFNDLNMGKFNFSTPFGPYVGFYSTPQTTVMVDYLKINLF